jgi:hypothetical protein
MLFNTMIQAQEYSISHFLGLNPSVTVEPFYEKGEFDVNILPIVYQKHFSKRFDFRVSSTVNYGIRKSSNSITHIGGQLAFPVYFKKSEDNENPNNGFFVAPGMGFTRNREEHHTNIGFWLEPGYNLLFSEDWIISFGMQFGATYFNYDSLEDLWGNHFGVKIFFGKWF